MQLWSLKPVINIKERVALLQPSLAGRVMYYCAPYRRKVILSNMHTVFGDQLDKHAKKRLMQSFYSHLLTSLKEMVQMRFMSEAKIRKSVEIINHHFLLEVAAQGQGVLVLTGHFGNWEFAPIGGILKFKEFQGQFHFIRKTLGFKWLERVLFRRYYQAGLHVIPKKNSLNQVCDALEKNHAVVFVLDQHAALANRDGIAVEFFGKKAGTYRSLAMLARQSGIPVIPASAYRKSKGCHILQFHEPIYWQEANSSQEGLYQNTLEYNKAIERIVLEHPEQWLWLHKRWKLKEY
jgi:KDO2-lipid IV(A) lauroyltransferase